MPVAGFHGIFTNGGFGRGEPRQRLLGFAVPFCPVQGKSGLEGELPSQVLGEGFRGDGGKGSGSVPIVPLFKEDLSALQELFAGVGENSCTLLPESCQVGVRFGRDPFSWIGKDYRAKLPGRSLGVPEPFAAQGRSMECLQGIIAGGVCFGKTAIGCQSSLKIAFLKKRVGGEKKS